MASQVQYRRGTNAQNAAFTGALGEITVDTTNGTLRVHDSVTVGGSNIATVAYVTSQISALSSNSISSGTSNVRVFANGNVTTSVAGTANVLNVTSTGAIITGDLSVTGNATLSGNILGDRIQNGTTIIDIQTANGNANISVAGTSNVAVFASTGAFITGVNSVSGNITGSNILTAGLISATGNITGGNILGGANVNATTHTGTTVSVTANITGGNILTAGLISATGNITGGNILGGANVNATTHTGTTVSVTANITGGNILTAGLVSATGAITGAAITGTGLTVSTGNITGGNLLLSGAIIDSAQLDIQTSAANANIALAPNGTGMVTVSTQVSAVGNITGGNIRTAGLISATGAVTGAAITGTSLTVSTGNVTCGNIVNSNANGVGNIGSATTYFNTVFAKATSAQYADLAEMYVSDNNYAPGTVVEFGGTHEITISSASHSTAVAGIISTNPSYLMNSAQTGEHVLPVALTGRVPCQVQGPVRKGDVLVASSTPGVAQRIGMNWQPGCILGKSMEGIDNSEIQTIEVAVGRT